MWGAILTHKFMPCSFYSTKRCTSSRIPPQIPDPASLPSQRLLEKNDLTVTSSVFGSSPREGGGGAAPAGAPALGGDAGQAEHGHRGPGEEQQENRIVEFKVSPDKMLLTFVTSSSSELWLLSLDELYSDGAGDAAADDAGASAATAAGAASGLLAGAFGSGFGARGGGGAGSGGFAGGGFVGGGFWTWSSGTAGSLSPSS